VILRARARRCLSVFPPRADLPAHPGILGLGAERHLL